MSRSYLVTGGAGFIGSNIVNQLVSTGNKVTVLDNLYSGYLSNLPESPFITFIKGDIRNVNIVNQVIKDVDVVFHLAASVGNKRSINNPKEDAEINVLGTMNILEAARRFGITRVVASSSAGIFGELKTLPINENHPLDPDTPYGCSKLCMEKECIVYAKIFEIETVCLRYFNVYGPNQRYDEYGNVIPKFVFRMLNNEPIYIYGDGEQTRDFINIEDVVQANIKASTVDKISGAFNIGSGTSITINKLVSIISESLEIHPKVIYKPVRLGDVLHSRADINLAKNAFGFSPVVKIEEGIIKYVSWALSFNRSQ